MIEVLPEDNNRWSKQKAAQTALDLQDACNLGGVTRALHEIFRAYLLDGTKAANESPPMKLAMHQAAWLATGQLLLANDEYYRARVACNLLAAGTQ